MPSKTILSFEIELRPPLLPTPAVNGLPLAPLGAGDILPGPAVPLDSPGKNICPTGPLLTDPQVLIPALLLAPPEPGRTRLRARHKSQQFSHWNLVGGLITGCFAVIWLLPSNGARARPVSIGNPIEAAKASIRNRAEVVYESDFGGGLDEWTRPPGSSPSWFKDRNGVVWPGRLEVYAPTRSMSDYRFEFVTSVDQALGAAFRFKDWNHYYGLEIRRSGRGSESEVQLVHYTVTGGIVSNRLVRRFPTSARNDSLFRLQLDVSGPNFTLMSQDKIVDYWSDGRYAKGGIGFFCGKDWRARLYRVRVSHQSDWVGRFFALLAKPEEPTLKE